MKKSLLDTCKTLVPGIEFIASSSFYWSPKQNAIHFDMTGLENLPGQWALIHEVAHAQLGHVSYKSDVGLLELEVAAWQTAQLIAAELELGIDAEHMQECLNTYRDWLYARSTCPTCSLNSLQIDETAYMCLNCSTRWNVSASRFCRPYRMQARHKKTPPELSQAVFV